MSETVLAATQALLIGTYPRTYTIPADRADVIETGPFVIIEEAVDIQERTVQENYIGTEFQSYWTLFIGVFCQKKPDIAGSVRDSEAKTIAWAARNAIRTILLANPTLSGTVDYIGETVELIEFGQAVGMMQWNASGWFGTYFLIPVKETIT